MERESSESYSEELRVTSSLGDEDIARGVNDPSSDTDSAEATPSHRRVTGAVHSTTSDDDEKPRQTGRPTSLDSTESSDDSQGPRQTGRPTSVDSTESSDDSQGPRQTGRPTDGSYTSTDDEKGKVPVHSDPIGSKKGDTDNDPSQSPQGIVDGSDRRSGSLSDEHKEEQPQWNEDGSSSQGPRDSGCDIVKPVCGTFDDDDVRKSPPRGGSPRRVKSPGREVSIRKDHRMEKKVMGSVDVLFDKCRPLFKRKRYVKDGKKMDAVLESTRGAILSYTTTVLGPRRDRIRAVFWRSWDEFKKLITAFLETAGRDTQIKLEKVREEGNFAKKGVGKKPKVEHPEKKLSESDLSYLKSSYRALMADEKLIRGVQEELPGVLDAATLRAEKMLGLTESAEKGVEREQVVKGKSETVGQLMAKLRELKATREKLRRDKESHERRKRVAEAARERATKVPTATAGIDRVPAEDGVAGEAVGKGADRVVSQQKERDLLQAKLRGLQDKLKLMKTKRKAQRLEKKRLVKINRRADDDACELAARIQRKEEIVAWLRSCIFMGDKGERNDRVMHMNDCAKLYGKRQEIYRRSYGEDCVPPGYSRFVKISDLRQVEDIFAKKQERLGQESVEFREKKLTVIEKTRDWRRQTIAAIDEELVSALNARRNDTLRRIQERSAETAPAEALEMAIDHICADECVAESADLQNSIGTMKGMKSEMLDSLLSTAAATERLRVEVDFMEAKSGFILNKLKDSQYKVKDEFAKHTMRLSSDADKLLRSVDDAVKEVEAIRPFVKESDPEYAEYTEFLTTVRKWCDEFHESKPQLMARAPRKRKDELMDVGVKKASPSK